MAAANVGAPNPAIAMGREMKAVVRKAHIQRNAPTMAAKVMLAIGLLDSDPALKDDVRAVRDLPNTTTLKDNAYANLNKNYRELCTSIRGMLGQVIPELKETVGTIELTRKVADVTAAMNMKNALTAYKTYLNNLRGITPNANPRPANQYVAPTAAQITANCVSSERKYNIIVNINGYPAAGTFAQNFFESKNTGHLYWDEVANDQPKYPGLHDAMSRNQLTRQVNQGATNGGALSNNQGHVRDYVVEALVLAVSIHESQPAAKKSTFHQIADGMSVFGSELDYSSSTLMSKVDNMFSCKLNTYYSVINNNNDLVPCYTKSVGRIRDALLLVCAEDPAIANRCGSWFQICILGKNEMEFITKWLNNSIATTTNKPEIAYTVSLIAHHFLVGRDLYKNIQNVAGNAFDVTFQVGTPVSQSGN